MAYAQIGLLEFILRNSSVYKSRDRSDIGINRRALPLALAILEVPTLQQQSD